jgi:hypothetical protein
VLECRSGKAAASPSKGGGGLTAIDAVIHLQYTRLLEGEDRTPEDREGPDVSPKGGMRPSRHLGQYAVSGAGYAKNAGPADGTMLTFNGGVLLKARSSLPEGFIMVSFTRKDADVFTVSRR